jgi:hypothetical protein
MLLGGEVGEPLEGAAVNGDSVYGNTTAVWHATLTDPRTFRGVVFSKSKGLRLVRRQNSSYMD